MSTELNTTRTLRLNVEQSTRMTVNTNGRDKGTPKCGCPSEALVNQTLTKHAMMFHDRERDRLPTLSATKSLNRSVSMFPSKSATLSTSRSAQMSHTKSATKFPNKTARQSTRKCPTESAEGSQRKFAMMEADPDTILMQLVP